MLCAQSAITRQARDRARETGARVRAGMWSRCPVPGRGLYSLSPPRKGVCSRPASAIRLIYLLPLRRLARAR
jgi:hypothetical protein